MAVEGIPMFLRRALIGPGSACSALIGSRTRPEKEGVTPLARTVTRFSPAEMSLRLSLVRKNPYSQIYIFGRKDNWLLPIFRPSKPSAKVVNASGKNSTCIKESIGTKKRILAFTTFSG